MADDPAVIWERATPPSRRHPPPRARVATPTAVSAPTAERRAATTARITAREAGRRFGLAVSTVRAWCRSGQVDAVMEDGPRGRQWMIAPASVAARKRRRGSTPSATATARSGPTADGTAMLVPRDAWDKVMQQLGNLHQAGQQLAEARERAARAETEASFLRERLAEMRHERDDLSRRLGTAVPPTGDGAGAPPGEGRLRRLRKLLGRRS